MMAAAIVGFVMGLAVGAVFFGGLWLTVERVERGASPSAWFVGSALVRAALALVGFWGALQLGPAGLLAALLAFLVVRTAATRFARPTHAPAAGPD